MPDSFARDDSAPSGVDADYAPLKPVPYDPELLAGMETMRQLFEPVPLRPDTIVSSREHVDALIPNDPAVLLGDAPVSYHEVSIPAPVIEGADSAPDIALSILTPTSSSAHSSAPRPGLYIIHGGGMVLGNRFMGVGAAAALCVEFDAVAVSVEYRLAPENPWPAGVEDCYSGLVWFVEHASELGVDPNRILVMGSSAGGGLTAAVCLLARERGGPHVLAQLLDAPMIDDRNETASARQYNGIGVWDRNNNDTAWTALLGEAARTDAVHFSAAPNRMNDLSSLPPAFVEVGSAEVFRDEAVAYASRIWAAGGECELHVWAGGHHGFSGFSPDAAVSRAAGAARNNWLHRILDR